MKPLIWIIDEEWADYQQEETLLTRALPDCEIRHSGNDYTADLAAFGHRADAVICQITVDMNAATIAALKQCRVISVYGAGYNNVDVAAARRQGITVCNVPGYCVEDVSDYVIAAIYHFNKSLGAFHAHIQDGRWGAQAVDRIVQRLSASCLLIIGCGRIGQALAAKALSLGMTVLCADPGLSDSAARELGLEKVELFAGLARADYVSVHAKLTPATTKLLNAQAFAALKPGAYFINAARGGVVDEAALVATVRSGRVAGALLDVVTTEPPQLSDEIFHCAGIEITPHISYLSQGALAELQSTAASNALCVIQGQAAVNAVLA